MAGTFVTLALASLALPALCLGQETFVWRYPPKLACPQLSLDSFGADRSGQRDVAPALANATNLANFAAPGIIFVTPGRYAVRSDVTVYKPVLVEPGAVFDVAAGVTLTITQPVSAGAQQIFSGAGSVKLLLSVTAILPEWFGARGDGKTDDAGAINRAFRAAAASTAELMFDNKTYGIASTVSKLYSVRVYSKPGAQLLCLKPGIVGMEYMEGDHVRPDTLPAFLGFSGVAIRFSDAHQTDTYIPLITTAPGKPCGVAMEMNADSTRIKFGTIKNCRTAVCITAPGGRNVMQGFHVEGGEVIDELGVTTDIWLFVTPKPLELNFWDHNIYQLKKVVPSQKATAFSFVRSDPPVKLPMNTFLVSEALYPLPPTGKLIASPAWDCVFRLAITQGFKDGQLDYSGGQFNHLIFEGAYETKPLRLATSPNSLRAFKTSNSLSATPYSNNLTLIAPQDKGLGAWRRGQLRHFFLYHQLAYQNQLHFFTVPGVGAGCTAGGFVAVVAMTDQSYTNKYEVVLALVACKDVPPSQELHFQSITGAMSSAARTSGSAPTGAATAAATPAAEAGESGGEQLELPVLDPVSDYEKIKRIGEGTFGIVYKARDRRSGELVALKRLRMERERDGMPVTSVRELRVLQSCKHPNLVELKKVVTGPSLDSVFLVFEYCPHDMGRLVDSMSAPFHESEVKCLMQQLLSAVCYLHDRWVMHRDLKLSNLLFTHEGRLKLCDYGLARHFQPWQECYTPGVVTLWYRAPEVLLGAEQYTEALDLWSCGCIMAELLKGDPLFPGRTEAAMLELMSELLGAPNDRIWPGMRDLPAANKFRLPPQPYNYLRKEFPRLSDAGIDLLNRLLTYDPERRITARQALRHPYFTERPLPRLPEYMPTFPSAHDAAEGEGGTRSDAAQHRRQRREMEEAHGRGVKRRYQQLQGGGDRFGDAFGDARAHKRPEMLRRLD